MKKILKIGGYVRVSHEEQKKFGYSINAQIEEIEKWCEKHNHQLYKLYIDEGYSASNMKRPQLANMLDDLPTLNAIVFTRLDRLSRNVFEANKMLQLLEKNDVSMIAISEENINTSTANGRFIFNLKVNLAQHELDKGSERIKAVFDYKVKDGQPITGTQPYGYKIGTINNKKQVVFDDEVKQIVMDSFDYFKKHHSIRQTMFYINDKHKINRAYASYKRLFNNKYYTGFYKNNPTYCPAYISMDQYNKNQKILKNNLKVRETNRIYLFSNFLKCPICSNKLTGYYSTRNKSWYRCNRNHTEKLCSFNKHIREEVIEKFLLDNVEKEFELYVLEFKKKIKRTDPTKRINEIKKELDKLNYIFRKDRISLEKYETEYDKLEKELKQLENEKVDDTFLDTKKLLTSNWKDVYNTLSKENKRAIWRNLISHLEITENKEIIIVF